VVGIGLAQPLKITVFTKPNCIWCAELLDKLQPLIEHTNVIVSPFDSSKDDMTPYVEKYGQIGIPSVLIGDVLFQGIPEEDDLVSLILKEASSERIAEPRIHTFSCSTSYSDLVQHIMIRIMDTASKSSTLFLIAEKPQHVPLQAFLRAAEKSSIFLLSNFEPFNPPERPELFELLNQHENVVIGHLKESINWFAATDEGFMKARRHGDTIFGAWSTNNAVAKAEIILTFTSEWQRARKVDKFLKVQNELLDPNLISEEIQDL
jgi:hypothetical protein